MSKIGEWKAQIPWKIKAKTQGKYYTRIFPEDISAVQSVFIYKDSLEIIKAINEDLEKFKPELKEVEKLDQ